MATRAPDYTLEGESGDRERYLVMAHQAGDPFAFTEIVKDHYTSMLGHAIRRMGDARAAEDVVQDALLRAYKSLHHFGGDYKLGAWLHRIVDNVCADEGGRRQRDAKLAERYGQYAEVNAPPADEDVADSHAAATVRAAVASLPDSYREALVLRDVMDMEYADVAERIGITEQNARARVSRARAALRKMVAPTVVVGALVLRGVRRGSGAATRIAAKLTSDITSAAGQAATTASQAATTVANTPPDVLTAPSRLAPAIGTLAATAVAAVASVGIPAFVTASGPAMPSSPPPGLAQSAPTKGTIIVETPGAPSPHTGARLAATVVASAPTTSTTVTLLVTLPAAPTTVPTTTVVSIPPTLPRVHTPKPAAAPVVSEGTFTSGTMSWASGPLGPTFTGPGELLTDRSVLNGSVRLAFSGLPAVGSSPCGAPRDAVLSITAQDGSSVELFLEASAVSSSDDGTIVFDQLQGFVLPSGGNPVWPAFLWFTGELHANRTTSLATLELNIGGKALTPSSCAAGLSNAVPTGSAGGSPNNASATTSSTSTTVPG